MFKHILIATDGSELSAQAVRAGVELAASLGAQVTAFHAAEPATPLVYRDALPVAYLPPPDHAALIEASTRRCLADAEAVAKSSRVACKTDSVISDFAADAIIEAAERHGCDLIFMASHGRRSLGSLLLGSQTQKVLAHSKIPVLVYR